MSGISSSTFSRCSREKILGTDPYADLDRETVSAILSEVDHLARTKLAESFTDGDGALPVFDPTHSVTLPETSGLSKSGSGTWQLELPVELGGQAHSALGSVGSPRIEHRRESVGFAHSGRPQVRLHVVGSGRVIDTPRS